jgi:two-component system, chemotaxis family, protein-glutamate methylesterase/glutaminase
MNASPIRVLLVDDSPVALAVLKRILSASPQVQVVGTAANGKEALELIPRLKPAVICTDFQMPVMDGLEFTRNVMSTDPHPILVISSTILPEDASAVYPLLEAGALDVFAKPAASTGAQLEAVTNALVAKIRILSGVHVFRRRSQQAEPPAPSRLMEGGGPSAPVRSPGQQVRAVVVGASTGGPIVLQTILKRLPTTYSLPILCVQHISPGFLQGLVEWLDAQCLVKVKIARSGELPVAGTVYLPAEGTHLEVDSGGRLISSHKAPVDGHRPSATVTMTSAACYYGEGAAGVLLTGMGRDGAAGLLAISRSGGVTIAQDEPSCTVFGMPRQAIELGAAQHVLSPDEITDALLRLGGGHGTCG